MIETIEFRAVYYKKRESKIAMFVKFFVSNLENGGRKEY